MRSKREGGESREEGAAPDFSGSIISSAVLPLLNPAARRPLAKGFALGLASSRCRASVTQPDAP